MTFQDRFSHKPSCSCSTRPIRFNFGHRVPLPLTIHPAAVYLRALGEGSRPTMQQSLNAIAALLSNGECDALTLDWAKLRYRHTAAVQAALLDTHDSVTVKKMMSARSADRGALEVRGGKGGKDRMAYLPEGAIALAFELVGEPRNRTGGAAEKAGINPHTSAHWLRHAHACHSLKHGARTIVGDEVFGSQFFGCDFEVSARSAD